MQDNPDLLADDLKEQVEAAKASCSPKSQSRLKTGILNAYNAAAQTHHVYAEVDGILAIDSREADGQYFNL